MRIVAGGQPNDGQLLYVDKLLQSDLVILEQNNEYVHIQGRTMDILHPLLVAEYAYVMDGKISEYWSKSWHGMCSSNKIIIPMIYNCVESLITTAHSFNQAKMSSMNDNP